MTGTKKKSNFGKNGIVPPGISHTDVIKLVTLM